MGRTEVNGPLRVSYAFLLVNLQTTTIVRFSFGARCCSRQHIIVKSFAVGEPSTHTFLQIRSHYDFKCTRPLTHMRPVCISPW